MLNKEQIASEKLNSHLFTHRISADKAFIVIQNERTKRLITILAARPGQIKRYWRNRNQKLPNDSIFRFIMNNAVNNQDMGLNNL